MAAEDGLSLQMFVCNLLNSVPGKQRNTWELEEYINSTPFPIEHKLNMEILENHFDGFVASFGIVLKVCLKLCNGSTTTCLCILFACVVAAEQQWQKWIQKWAPKQFPVAYFMNLFPNVNFTIPCIQVMTTYIIQQSVIFHICIGHGHNILSNM